MSELGKTVADMILAQIGTDDETSTSYHSAAGGKTECFLKGVQSGAFNTESAISDNADGLKGCVFGSGLFGHPDGYTGMDLSHLPSGRSDAGVVTLDDIQPADIQFLGKPGAGPTTWQKLAKNLGN
jgi:hypothetical protein